MDLATALSGRSQGDTRRTLIGRLVSIDTGTNRMTVTIDGSEPVALPFSPGAYTGVTTVLILRDARAGDWVLGPVGTEASPPPPPPPAPEPTAPKTVSDTALIRPTWSGTYRTGGPFPGWDQWNVGRYGGRSTLYQGNAYGSGPLTGLAVYGNQLTNLGALTIDRMTVYTPLATGSGSVTLQGSASGTKPGGAPSSSGATASGVTAVDLDDATCEAFRVGTFKGLACVGAGYRGTRGTSHPKGMAIAVTYRRAA